MLCSGHILFRVYHITVALFSLRGEGWWAGAMFYGSIAQRSMKYAELSQIRKSLVGRISSWSVKVREFYFASGEIDILKKRWRKLNL